MATKVTRQWLEAQGYSGLSIKAKAENPRTKAVDHEGMNRTERAYADHLATLKLCGEIRDWSFEPFKFRIAGKTFLTPDFLVSMPNWSVQIHDVKGHLEDDAAVKIKAVADRHPWFRFWLVYREGGEWVYRPVTRNGIGRKGEWAK